MGEWSWLATQSSMALITVNSRDSGLAGLLRWASARGLPDGRWTTTRISSLSTWRTIWMATSASTPPSTTMFLLWWSSRHGLGIPILTSSLPVFLISPAFICWCCPAFTVSHIIHSTAATTSTELAISPPSPTTFTCHRIWKEMNVKFCKNFLCYFNRNPKLLQYRNSHII